MSKYNKINCSVCNSTNKLKYNKKFNKVFCMKHYLQIIRYGKIRSGRNLYYDNKIYIISRDCSVLVDSCFSDGLDKHTWGIDTNGYVYTNIKRKKVYLHRFLLNAPSELFVDHINHDKSDNRRSNLRLCTHQENNMNQRIFDRGTSKYKGVFYDKRYNVWLSRISVNNISLYLGTYYNERDAAIAYNTAAIKYYKEFANLNEV